MAYVYALINKDTLAYICREKGVTGDFIANKTKISATNLALWLAPSDSALPTIKQAKKLASCLHIPFAGLYMNSTDIPLKKIPNVRNMRTMLGTSISDDSALNVAMIDVLLERDFLLNANDELRLTTKTFLPVVPEGNDPRIWANAIREQFSISLEQQYKCSSARQFYLYLREKIESEGVFIHCFTDVPIDTARGFAIYYEDLPIIGINDEDRPPAKSFSIIHELVHLFKRESSLCNDMNNSVATKEEEVFCNAVAGELLVPQDAISIVLSNNNCSAPYSKEDLKRIADRFSVSREVIIRRLLDLNKISKIEYDTYVDMFRKEIDYEREKQRTDRKNGINNSIPRNISREAIDRTSPSVSKVLYRGYGEEIYSKQDIARHLNIDQKHINKFLTEVAKWSN
ncbi:MAG TPA: ImmA/IrrE family metallo-endopeptidase [Firmicutes bacterium]|nr:ImmA/IrrE family metallo-endopeptidase [Bacillota bacterium]